MSLASGIDAAWPSRERLIAGRASLEIVLFGAPVLLVINRTHLVLGRRPGPARALVDPHTGVDAASPTSNGTLWSWRTPLPPTPDDGGSLVIGGRVLARLYQPVTERRSVDLLARTTLFAPATGRPSGRAPCFPFIVCTCKRWWPDDTWPRFPSAIRLSAQIGPAPLLARGRALLLLRPTSGSRRLAGRVAPSIEEQARRSRRLQSPRARAPVLRGRVLALERTHPPRGAIDSLPLMQLSSHDAGVAGAGVIQQRALDGGRGPFHAPVVVRADDRFRSDARFRPAIASATIQWCGVAPDGIAPGTIARSPT